ncbi:MAG: pro-sigmaK processing inhibitor BofA family protein [Oscillospiraceae bacterium]|nr:pro-sigmaK processing inhibitor BofA family protein [Oscillospiraceae bacterium]
MDTAVIILSCLLFFYVCIIYIKNKCIVKGLIFNGISGVGTLAVLSLYGSSLGLALPFSFYSGILCMALGLPGVLFLSILKLIWLI